MFLTLCLVCVIPADKHLLIQVGLGKAYKPVEDMVRSVSDGFFWDSIDKGGRVVAGMERKRQLFEKQVVKSGVGVRF